VSRKLPPLYALRAFEVAARCESFTQAATQLSLSQSAISRHIHNLEETLACKLFERHGPRVRLTETGRRFAQQLSQGFQLIESACQAVQQKPQALRLKCPTSLTSRWLLRHVEAWKQQTGAKIQLSSVWMDIDEVDFSTEPFDCAILLADGHFEPGIGAVELIPEWLIPVAVPGLIEPDQNLAQLPMIHPSPDKRDWQRWLARVYPALEVELADGMVFDTLEQGAVAALQGLGISVADLAMVIDDIRAGRLECPYPQAIATGDSYWLIWPEDSPLAEETRELADWLCNRVPDIDLPALEFMSA